MKKLFLLLAVFTLAFAMVACGSSEKSDDKKETDTKEKTETNDNKDTDTKDDESTDTNEENSDSEQGKLLFEYEDLKVSLKSVETNDSDELLCANLVYDNTGKTSYQVDLKYIVVNGIQIDSDYPLKRVYEESTDSSTYEIKDYTIEFFEMTKVDSCAFIFSVSELDEDEELYCSDLVYIYGDESTPKQTFEGTELLNENGIRIYVISLFESSNGPSFKMCIENSHDKDINIATLKDAVIVNGGKANDSLYGYTGPNCTRMLHYYIDGVYRKELGIETWEDIQTIQWTIDACYRDYKDEADMLLTDKTFSAEITDGNVVAK